MYFTKNDIDRITEASKGHLLDVAQDFHELRKSESIMFVIVLTVG